MKDGEMFKEYSEYIRTRFTTKKGLADFFVVTALWYAIIVEVLGPWHDSILVYWGSFIPWSLLSQYLTYLTLGIIFASISLALRFVLEKVWRLIFNGGVN